MAVVAGTKPDQSSAACEAGSLFVCNVATYYQHNVGLCFGNAVVHVLHQRFYKSQSALATASSPMNCKLYIAIDNFERLHHHTANSIMPLRLSTSVICLPPAPEPQMQSRQCLGRSFKYRWSADFHAGVSSLHMV